MTSVIGTLASCVIGRPTSEATFSGRAATKLLQGENSLKRDVLSLAGTPEKL